MTRRCWWAWPLYVAGVTVAAEALYLLLGRWILFP